VNIENSDIETETPEVPEIPVEEISKEQTPAEEPVTGETVAARSNARRGGSALALFAFLFALAALAGTGWMWWQDQASIEQEEKRIYTEIARLESSDSELSLKLSQIRNEIDSLAAGDVGAEFEAMQKRLQADRLKMGSVEQTINDQLKLSRSLQAAAESMQGRLVATEAALTGMSTRELDAGGELDIAEVDYLLRLANERLKLFFDAVAADQALEVADMHLAALDNPMYLGVRQDIAAARRNLAAVDVPDYLQIANDLDSIQDQVVSLPFHGEDPPETATAGPAEAEGWWQKIKGVFSGLVTVRRSTDQENQRISLEDKDYIRQRVWLQLEIAHLSLMRKDQDGFTTSLARVEESLSSWFDTSDSSYQAIIQGIDKLKAQEIQAELPDITTPWSTLRMLRAGQSRPVVAPQPAEQDNQG
jgi:uroporphyrin-3 C-methyltransferase